MTTSETGILPQSQFLTTHWSTVLSASSADSAAASDALEKLCRAYWYPLYAFARRRGKSPADAQDLTQEFFARLLQRHWLARADHSRGRFRTFLLTAFEHFLANDWDKDHALKRGGGVEFVPIDFTAAETRYGCEPADPVTPARAFERRWALTLLERVLGQLEADYRTQGKAALFSALKPALIGDPASQPYAQLAQALGLSESGLRVAIHRLRETYRRLLRSEIANTVGSADDVDSEMRHLFNVLAGHV